jgi:hypothetical protein
MLVAVIKETLTSSIPRLTSINMGHASSKPKVLKSLKTIKKFLIAATADIKNASWVLSIDLKKRPAIAFNCSFLLK